MAGALEGLLVVAIEQAVLDVFEDFEREVFANVALLWQAVIDAITVDDPTHDVQAR